METGQPRICPSWPLIVSMIPMLRLTLLFLLTTFVGTALAANPPAGTAAQVAPIPKPDINYAALDKLGWKLGCQAYTFRALTLFETLDILHDLDIHYVELFPGQKLSPENPKVLTKHDMAPEFVKML